VDLMLADAVVAMWGKSFTRHGKQAATKAVAHQAQTGKSRT